MMCCYDHTCNDKSNTSVGSTVKWNLWRKLGLLSWRRRRRTSGSEDGILPGLPVCNQGNANCVENGFSVDFSGSRKTPLKPIQVAVLVQPSVLCQFGYVNVSLEHIYRHVYWRNPGLHECPVTVEENSAVGAGVGMLQLAWACSL